jgi:hypothetical protein
VVFDGDPSTPKHPNQGDWGGSRESGTEENLVAETDLEKAARENLTKH